MQKRYVLCWMLFFLVACNTLVTLNIDIAIVSMVNFTDTEENSSTQSTEIVCTNSTYFLRSPDISGLNIHLSSKDAKYNWSKQEQSKVLSAYYWLSYVAIMPAGVLAQKYGSKTVVGYAQGISSIMSSLIPFVADYGYATVAWVRAIQGILSFISVPAGFVTIIGNWSPPQDRGIFGSAMLSGSCFGYGVANYSFALIAQYFHWSYIFHVTSICGLLWLVFWYYLIYDQPHNHPFISSEEKSYIADNLPSASKEAIPWKSILVSIPVNACVWSTIGFTWCFVVMATFLPVYLKTSYYLTNDEIGVIASFPVIGTIPIVLAVGYINDTIIRKKLLTLTTIRKINNLIGWFFNTMPLVVMAFAKCNVNLAVASASLHFLLRGIAVFGSSMGTVDLSPRFCSIIQAITGTLGSILTFLLTLVMSHLRGVLNNEDFWKTLYLTSAILATVTTIFYHFFGTSRVQSWNSDISDEKTNSCTMDEIHR